MPKQLRKLMFIVAIIVIIIVLVKMLNIPDVITKIIYPQKYSDYVYKFSEENNIDPALTFAIIKAESNFDEKVVSSSGAIGLMQLMEKTGMEQSKKMEKNYQYKDLYNPEINIELGTAYLAELINRYNGNYYLAITAYNAGIGVVDGWIADGIIKSDGSDIENIPYKETNTYVRKIIKNYKIYKKYCSLGTKDKKEEKICQF